jgi:predicted DCC family thiol-disulfide oxidoreductase YuxK
VIVLYDADCGFCRWAMAWALRRDDRHRLVAVPIQSPLGSELLADLSPGDRLRSAHVVGDDGRRRSGGAAAAAVLSVLPSTRALARLAHGLPGTTASLYSLVAAQRVGFGRFVGDAARQRADRLLGSTSATTASELPRAGASSGALDDTAMPSSFEAYLASQRRRAGRASSELHESEHDRGENGADHAHRQET